eukprot:1844936-Rhodomonas_salina.6
MILGIAQRARRMIRGQALEGGGVVVAPVAPVRASRARSARARRNIAGMRHDLCEGGLVSALDRPDLVAAQFDSGPAKRLRCTLSGGWQGGGEGMEGNVLIRLGGEGGQSCVGGGRWTLPGRALGFGLGFEGGVEGRRAYQ